MARNQRLLLIFGALLAAAIGMNVVRPSAHDLETEFEGDAEIVAATFSSAWCSSCRVLAPKLASVIPDFRNEAVAFVDLDFTFGDTLELGEEAARAGIADIYERNKGATGFTLLVDAQSGEILDALTMNFSQSAMRAAIAQALAIASSTDESGALDAYEKE